MEDDYGIGITNRYAFLLDTDANDPQAILKQKAKKAKKAAKKLAGKENTENDGKVETKPEKLTDEKKVKFVVSGKGGKQSQNPPNPPISQQEQPSQKSRSMKDTQNIQGNGNTENAVNGFSQTKGNFNRERYGNNRNYEHRENRNRRNKEGGTESNDAGNETSQENVTGPPNRNYRTSQQNGFGPTNRAYRTDNAYRNNENSNNGQDIENNQPYNNQREHRDDDRPARSDRRQGNDRNFGNRRFDGQRRNYDGRSGKREFDRQSGSDKTGVKAVDKREGGGAHNWGSAKQDVEDMDKIEPDLKEDGNSDGNAKSEENLVVEEVLLTLDEYKQLQGQRAKPVYNTRKAGEGEDKKKWKNLVPLQKKKDESKSEDEYEYDPAQYPQRKRGIRYIKDIKVCFNEGKRIGFNNNNNRNRRRPGGDGRRNDEANAQNAPQVDDRNFPSLG